MRESFPEGCPLRNSKENGVRKAISLGICAIKACPLAGEMIFQSGKMYISMGDADARCPSAPYELIIAADKED